MAASPGYVACDKYGLARSAELRCGLAFAAGWAVASTFRKEERGERVRLLSLSRGCSPCPSTTGLAGGCQGHLLLMVGSSQGMWFAPLDLLTAAQGCLPPSGSEAERETCSWELRGALVICRSPSPPPHANLRLPGPSPLAGGTVGVPHAGPAVLAACRLPSAFPGC